MNLGESAARMRVNRAIERLRSNLGHAGVTVSGVALLTVLDRDAQAAVHVHLLNAVSVPGAASSGSTGASVLLAKGTLIAMATTTTKILTATCAVALLAGGGFIAVRAA